MRRYHEHQGQSSVILEGFQQIPGGVLVDRHSPQKLECSSPKGVEVLKGDVAEQADAKVSKTF